MIIVYSTRGNLRVLFTDIPRSLVFHHSKVRKRLTKKLIFSYSYSWKFERLPYRYVGRNLTEETVRSIEREKIGYLYSL